RFAGFRVASHARRTIVQAEAAETANLDAFPVRERLAHLFEQALHGELHIASGEVRLARGQGFNQLRLGHLGRHSSRWGVRPHASWSGRSRIATTGPGTLLGTIPLLLEQFAELGRGGTLTALVLVEHLLQFFLVLG